MGNGGRPNDSNGSGFGAGGRVASSGSAGIVIVEEYLG